jgi:hypothetical protein
MNALGYSCVHGNKREPGENPGRSGHCEWGAAFRMPLFGTVLVPDGKAKVSALIHESGDLPECQYLMPSVERLSASSILFSFKKYCTTLDFHRNVKVFF